MSPTARELIEKCTHESHAGLLTFPQVLECLIGVGVESYFADYRNHSATYYLFNNEALRVDMEMPPVEIPKLFNQESVVLAIRKAQNDLLRYPEFLELTMAAGCVGYIVWITGRHVSYFGREGKVHIERFP